MPLALTHTSAETTRKGHSYTLIGWAEGLVK